MNSEEIRQIAVIGSGIMGHGIAQVCICSGYKVIIEDIRHDSLIKAVDLIKQGMQKLVKKNKIKQQDLEKSMSHLHTTINSREAISEAELIIEAVPEKYQLKQKVLKEISDLASENSIIATNTSTMSISNLSKCIRNPERFAGMHFFNPAPRMKLIEIIQGDNTSPETIATLVDTAKRLGKLPIKVLKDSPGFIVNRSNAPGQALLNVILEEGIITPDEVDTGMKKLGMPMGPFELADFIGLDVFTHTLSYYKDSLSTDYKPGSFLLRKIDRNELGQKTGRGIYDWSEGKALINTDKQSSEITPISFIALQVNEAIKILKEGIASSRQDIDDAVKNGMNAFAGPFALASGVAPDQLVSELNNLYSRFNLKIFKPEPELINGSFKEL